MTRSVFTLFLWLALVSSITSVAEENPTRTITGDRVNSSMKVFVDKGELAGVTSLVASAGKIVYLNSVGKRDRERDLAMTDDTIYRIYSMTKPITAVAVMILAEEGHILLDNPVADYLPEFRDPVVYSGRKGGEVKTVAARPITIKHLLTHTSGIIYPWTGSAVAGFYQDAGITGGVYSDIHDSLAGLTATLGGLPLASQPGSEWHYGLSIDVLGRLVEVVSGKNLRDFMIERIFRPLEMVDTDFFVPDDKAKRFAAMYLPTKGGGLKLQDDPQRSLYRAEPKYFSGGMGLVSTARDYSQFARMLLNGGELNGVRILGIATAQLILTNHVPPGLPTDPIQGVLGYIAYGDARGMGYGLGGFIVTEPGKTDIPLSKGTYGWHGMGGTSFWIDPEKNLVGVVLTQIVGGHNHPLHITMQRQIYQVFVENDNELHLEKARVKQ